MVLKQILKKIKAKLFITLELYWGNDHFQANLEIPKPVTNNKLKIYLFPGNLFRKHFEDFIDFFCTKSHQEFQELLIVLDPWCYQNTIG